MLQAVEPDTNKVNYKMPGYRKVCRLLIYVSYACITLLVKGQF